MNIGDPVVLIGFENSRTPGRYLGPHDDPRYEDTHARVSGEAEYQQAILDRRPPQVLGWPLEDIEAVAPAGTESEEAR